MGCVPLVGTVQLCCMMLGSAVMTCDMQCVPVGWHSTVVTCDMQRVPVGWHSTAVTCDMHCVPVDWHSTVVLYVVRQYSCDM